MKCNKRGRKCMTKEIERKYLIKRMPNLNNIKPIRYESFSKKVQKQLLEN